MTPDVMLPEAFRLLGLAVTDASLERQQLGAELAATRAAAEEAGRRVVELLDQLATVTAERDEARAHLEMVRIVRDIEQ